MTAQEYRDRAFGAYENNPVGKQITTTLAEWDKATVAAEELLGMGPYADTALIQDSRVLTLAKFVRAITRSAK